MVNLAVRAPGPELMDDPAVDEATFRDCLADLASVNSWTFARPPTLRWLEQATKGMRRFTLLDVGYGQGDMLRAVHGWATRRGLEPELIGVDLSPWSASAARAATPPGMAIEYRTGDVFAFDPGRRIDFVVSSLVAHHFTDAELTGFLGWMEERAARGWFVNDLHRHAVAYHGFRLMSTLMRWHHFVRHDGPLSVARAFRRADWERLVADAGLPRAGVTLRWHLPFRLCVGRIK